MAILWYCLKPEDQRKLEWYQWKYFGLKLIPPPDDWQTIRYGMMIESDEELASLMRQKPKYNGRVWFG